MALPNDPREWTPDQREAARTALQRLIDVRGHTFSDILGLMKAYDDPPKRVRVARVLRSGLRVEMADRGHTFLVADSRGRLLVALTRADRIEMNVMADAADADGVESEEQARANGNPLAEEGR